MQNQQEITDTSVLLRQIKKDKALILNNPDVKRIKYNENGSSEF